MKMRNLLGLSAIGAAYYAHRRRGGELTLDSARESVHALGQWMKSMTSRQIATTKDDTAKTSATVEPTDAEELFPSAPGFAGGDGLYPGK